jgi:hypothetical protein
MSPTSDVIGEIRVAKIAAPIASPGNNVEHSKNLYFLESVYKLSDNLT